MRSIGAEMKGKVAIITGVTLNVSGGMEFGTIPKYYAFDESNTKMREMEQAGEANHIVQQ